MGANRDQAHPRLQAGSWGVAITRQAMTARNSEIVQYFQMNLEAKARAASSWWIRDSESNCSMEAIEIPMNGKIKNRNRK